MKFIKNLSLVAVLIASICRSALGVVGFTISPNTVSNTYAGTIQLQITGLASGGTVVVQKFLDANTNGVIDAADPAVQQFTMTDGQPGQAIGGVTNNNVPGDTDGAANGTITAKLNFQNGDFVQSLVGQFLVKVSGNFSPPITNVFTVTNFPFAQKFTGNVVSNSSSALLSNAVVILFPAPRPGHHGPGQPVAGAVANNGAYSIMVPAGTYTLLAFYTNYVGSFQKAPVLTLGSSQTINTNLTLTNATGSIIGRIVDAGNNTIGLPGMFMPLSSTNNLLVSGFTDTNGNFSAPVTASQWNLGSDDSGLIVHGYVGLTSSDTTNVNSGANVTLAFPKANAMFYGSFKDNLGNPFVGIDFNDNDSSNLYSMDGYTDTNGTFFIGAVGGLGNNDLWQLNISSESGGNLTNYDISQPQLSQNNGTNIAVGQALLVNFTGILATNIISGTVKDNLNTAISNVQVYAFANIGGQNYQPQANTDVNGNYSLNVANGNWGLNVYCGGGQNSLSTNYMCPNSIPLNIAGNNVVTNFVVQQCSGISISPLSPLPVGEVNAFYYQTIQAADCNGNYNWSQTGGTLPGGTSLNAGGSTYVLSGSPNGSGTFTFTVQVNDGGSNSTNRQYSLAISNALQITTTTLPNGTNGLNYSQQLQATAGVPFGGGVPYSWSLSSGSLPANLNLATNGLLSGTAVVNGTFNFSVQVADSIGAMITQALSLTLITTNIPPLTISTAGGQIYVLWPASAGTNFTLQTATNVTGPWVTASNGVPQNAFSFSNNAPDVFFRLH